ncbi:MAG: hypothetical protein Q9183_001759, partial [Haloplaca sp. 2 TL-2023]
MIKVLVESMDDGQDDCLVLKTFHGPVISFYLTISHPEVASSLVLERSLETIYNFLYGSGGHRGVQAFRFTAKAISLALVADDDGQAKKPDSFLTPCLAALERTLELNQGAQLQQDLLVVVKSISGSVAPIAMLPDSRRRLDKIRLRLGLASLIPVARSRKQANTPAATFKLHHDLPGELSSEGRRHDNDHQNITDIHILPTADEIQSSRLEYLPHRNSTDGHLIGLEGLLDRHFRLLREDAIGGLRDAVRREAERLENGHLGARPPQRNLERTHVHPNLRLRRWELDRRKGIQLVVDFDHPAAVGRATLQQRKDWWDSSRRLQPSSLVCLVASDGHNIFCLVCDPTPTAPFRKKDQGAEDDKDIPNLAEMEYQRKRDEMPNLYGDESRDLESVACQVK